MVHLYNDFNLKNKFLLVRLDINSPVVKGKIQDSPRLKESAKTISILQKKGAKIVLIAHQGRKGDDDFTSLDQHAKLLSKHIRKKVRYVDFLFEKEAIEEIKKLKPQEVILLKNVREYKDELKLDLPNKYYSFSKLFDLYVNDAFSVSHRAQASIILPPRVIPGCIGPSFKKELDALSRFHLTTKSKGVYFLGGSKIEDYLPLFNVLKNKKNIIIASGILANLFFVAKGFNLGYENKWLKQKGYTKLIPQLKELLQKYHDQIILPVDFAFDIGGRRIELPIEKAPFKEKIWDVGHQSVELYLSELNGSDLVFMKGPLGYSEIKKFSFATVTVLEEISKKSKRGVFSLLGGGHLTTSISEYNIKDNFSYISLSGGALIKYLSGEPLVGLQALEKP
jgi:phosphoglycerate kinase